MQPMREQIYDRNREWVHSDVLFHGLTRVVPFVVDALSLQYSINKLQLYLYNAAHVPPVPSNLL